MAASRIVKYVLLVTAAFAIGAALAVWQRDPAPETAPVEASAGLEGAPQAEAPMDMPDYGNAQDVIIDAPEMPAPPPPSASPTALRSAPRRWKK